MTSAGLIRAWLLGPLVLLAALVIATQLAPEPGRQFHGAEVAVIGSSLTADAVPETGRSTVIGGAKHWRVGISSPSESQILELLDRTVAERPKLILLEVNTLVARFAFDPQRKTCVQSVGGFRRAVKGAHIQMADALRRLFGARSLLEGIGEPHQIDRRQEIHYAQIKKLYPLTIRPPCDEPRLRAAFSRAREHGTRIALMALPRSPTGQRLLGPVQSRAAQAEARALAARLDVPLFEPAGPWQDAEFVDHAHLSASGRAHFVSAVRIWLEAEP